MSGEAAPAADRGSALEVLAVFLRLGLTCFGGPVAHIGYFRQEFVARRRWLGESAYAELVALCQFLPGPASSQVGFSIGLMRAGYRGGLAAWAGFTLPSAAAMLAFAYAQVALRGGGGHGWGDGLLHGLKLVAVAVVAQALWGMARSLTPDARRVVIALLCGALILFTGSAFAQLAAIALGGVAGYGLCREAGSRPADVMPVPVSRRAGIAALAAFMLMLAGLPVAHALWDAPRLALFEAFYRSGALVFGGGHVVLPLLRQALVAPGWVADDAFLAGYGAAQAVPGPLFTFAAYLGAVAQGASGAGGIAGAALGLAGIFLPGLLIVLAALPFWGRLRTRPGAQAVMRGVNAAVVGLLAAALYQPVWTSSVNSLADAAVALIGFLLLAAWRLPPLAVVVLGALAGVALQLAGWA
jgi:chromate transporter